MLPKLVRAAFDDVGRGDDRRPAVPADGSAFSKPAVLGRWTVRLLSLLGIIGIVYGSLAPFRIDPHRSWSLHLGWQAPGPGDGVANVLIYVPIGLLARLMFRRRGSFWLTEWVAALFLVAALSYLSEVFQTVLAYRVPSWADVVWNGVGASVGIACGPLFQRVLRNEHAWLYGELRARPFTAAASATVLVTCVAALMPFDVHPTPAHLASALGRIARTSFALPWASGADPVTHLPPVQCFDKLLAAGAYGLVAFMMVLATREAGRRPISAAWYALTRSAAIAAAVELLQLFTISHLADPHDLLLAWVFCGLGVAMGYRAVSGSPTGLPRPVSVLRGLVVLAILVLVVRATVAAATAVGRPVPVMSSWLPMAASFHRPWEALLASYVSGTIQYGLAAALVALWLRTGRRSPRGSLVLAAAVVGALWGQALAVGRGQPVDTAHFLLALVAGAVVLRIDRALFGARSVAAVA